MSYDLIFVPRTEDQSWEDALDAAGERESDSPPDAETWTRILAAARAVLGEVSVSQAGDSYELDQESTGIELSYYAAECMIRVPYWYQGPDAQAVVEKVYRLGRIVETETGLPGYDAQLELPLSEAIARPEQAVEIFDEVAASFAARDIHSPGNA